MNHEHNTPSPDWRCNCHLKHSDKLAQLEKDQEKHEEDHKMLDSCIRNKVSNTMFKLLISILALIMGGMLTFQWANYEKLSKFETKVTEEIAVVKTKLDTHMQSTKYPYYPRQQ
jgi:hypothetical protein